MQNLMAAKKMIYAKKRLQTMHFIYPDFPMRDDILQDLGSIKSYGTRIYFYTDFSDIFNDAAHILAQKIHKIYYIKPHTKHIFLCMFFGDAHKGNT